MGHDRDDDDRGRHPRHPHDHHAHEAHHDPRRGYAQSGGPSRVYNRDVDMGGSHWSGASGRGGIAYPSRFDEGASGEGRRFGGANDFGAHDYGPSRGSDMGFMSPYHQQELRRDPGERDRDRGPHWGKGPKGYRRSDARILEDVCEAIADQGHIDASDVEVKVEEGVVVLTGTVGLRHHKRSLEILVENCRGVDEVRNELRLRRDGRASAGDPQSTRDITRAGQESGTMPGSEIAPRSNGRSGATGPARS